MGNYSQGMNMNMPMGGMGGMGGYGMGGMGMGGMNPMGGMNAMGAMGGMGGQRKQGGVMGLGDQNGNLQASARPLGGGGHSQLHLRQRGIAVLCLLSTAMPLSADMYIWAGATSSHHCCCSAGAVDHQTLRNFCNTGSIQPRSR
jgi:hypothetical protein